MAALAEQEALRVALERRVDAEADLALRLEQAELRAAAAAEAKLRASTTVCARSCLGMFLRRLVVSWIGPLMQSSSECVRMLIFLNLSTAARAQVREIRQSRLLVTSLMMALKNIHELTPPEVHREN